MFDCDHFARVVFQNNLPVKVEREAYGGPVIEMMMQNMNEKQLESNPIIHDQQAFSGRSRGATSSGGRHMQDSSFSLSGMHALDFVFDPWNRALS